MGTLKKDHFAGTQRASQRGKHDSRYSQGEPTITRGWAGVKDSHESETSFVPPIRGRICRKIMPSLYLSLARLIFGPTDPQPTLLVYFNTGVRLSVPCLRVCPFLQRALHAKDR